MTTWLHERLSRQPHGQPLEESSESITDKTPPVRDDSQDIVNPSVSEDLVKQAQARLRQLGVEKEALNDALTHLDTAKAIHRVPPVKYQQLQAKYRGIQHQLTTHIQRNKLLLKLHQLEGTRINLIQIATQQIHATTQEIERLQARP